MHAHATIRLGASWPAAAAVANTFGIDTWNNDRGG